MMARLTAEQRRQRRPSNGRRRNKGPERGLHKLSVQKPFCSPAKYEVLQALEPYGIKVHRCIDVPAMVSVKDFARLMKVELREFENLRYGPMAITLLPMACQANVWVSEAQANWAEYLIERTQRLAVVGGSMNGNNRRWADQHDGKMPRPWVEKSCKEGQDIWQQVKQIKEGNR